MKVQRLALVAGVIVSLLSLVAFASLLGGRERQVSIDVWIAVVAIWLAFLLLHQLTVAAPGTKDKLRNLFPWARTSDESRPHRGPEVVLEGLLIGARDSERAMALRLRPRLVELAGHLLRTRHGIDLEGQPERAADRLGDLWWLIDQQSADWRSPSFDEIDQLLDLLLDDKDHR